MDRLSNTTASSSEPTVTSSPEILSPGGKSRYGRTRRPKVSRDFCNIDDVDIDEVLTPRQSPVKSPRLKPHLKPVVNSPEIVFEIKDEFTKLDDLGMKVANNFKTNLQRGLDDTIKERKFFKSMPESKVDVLNVVDVTKVFKLISTKATVSGVCDTKTTPKIALKTYSNRRKHLHDSESFIVESFGLPDEPIIPVNSPLPVVRDTKIDVDVNCEVDVNLKNPWVLEEFQPLYASEPISAMDEIPFRGGMLDFLAYDGLMSENTKMFDVASNCQDYTDFEKSRIPTPVSSEMENKIKEKSTKRAPKKNAKLKSQHGKDSVNSKKRVLRSSLDLEKQKSNIEDKNKLVRVLRSSLDLEKQKSDLQDKDKLIEEKSCKVKTDIGEKDIKTVEILETEEFISPKPKRIKKDITKAVNKKTTFKKSNFKSPSRILRSSFDNNNSEEKNDISSSLSQNTSSSSNTEVSSAKDITKTSRKLPDVKSSNKVLNPVNAIQNICSPQIRVILNPLACLQKYAENKNLVPNPYKINNEKSKLKVKHRINVRSDIKTKTVRKFKRKALFKRRKIKSTFSNSSTEMKDQPVDTKNIKVELIEFEVGDLAWAKIGTHPYWPCLVTEEPVLGVHKKTVVNRAQPMYHVRFFGDKGRRSWVSAQYVMLFNGRDDLEKLSKQLKAENHVKNSYIKEACVVKLKKLPKWQTGVNEAESLQCKTVQERLDYFFDLFASTTEKRQKMITLGIKYESCSTKSENEKSPKKNNKRNRVSEEVVFSKKVKMDSEEINNENSVKDSLDELKIKEEVLDEIGANLKDKNTTDVSRKKNLRKSLGNENSPAIKSPSKKINTRKVEPEKIEKIVSPVKRGLKLKNAERTSTKVISPKILRSNSNGNTVTSSERKKKVGEHSLSGVCTPELVKTPEKSIEKLKTQENKTIEPKSSAEKFDEDNSLKKTDLNANKSPEKRKKRKKSTEEEFSFDDLPLATLSTRLRHFETPESSKSSKNTPEASKETTPQPFEGRKKFLKPEEYSDESLAARKKLRNSQPKNETVEIPQEVRKETLDAPKVPERNSTEERKESEEKELKVRNKRHQLGGEYSNSDTDSKFSDNSSVPASLESQAALFRRNNIFRGISREKVCQVCEEGGEVFKCKGPCNGVYHYTCSLNEMKHGNVEENKPKIEEEEHEGKEKNTVEIISVNSKQPLPDLSKSPTYKGMTLSEKIDFRMKEIMKKFDYQSVYSEATDSSSEDLLIDESLDKSKNQPKISDLVTKKPTTKEVPMIKHVTADNISYHCVPNERPKETEETDVSLIKENLKNSKCSWCTFGETARCLVCQKDESKAGSKFRQKCSLHQCGKYYHPECLKIWPQTQWSVIQSTKDEKSDAMYDTFVCPRHVCHTCISDDPRVANSRCPSDKVVKCLKCPATYHSSSYCVPAGSHILSTSQIICPRHFTIQNPKKKIQQTINTNWCFLCSKGGNLICCETCPTSVHVECLPGDLNEDDTFFCEDCQSGRLPLYDEIVWVKLGSFRWWPAVILFPNEVPDNVRNIVHNKGEFVVKFYGTYDHYWVGRGRTFLFQEGDKGHSCSIRKRVDNAFAKAIEEAATAHQLKKEFKLSKVAEKNSGLKPPPYIRIKVNKPVGNVRLFDGNTSNTTSCECDPHQPHPCGPDSDCLNRLLLTECNPEVCPAGERCNNQCFEKREYPPLIPHRTQVRGWGLKTLAPIRKGQFVIEYVGEIIDEQEYQRRVQKMHEQKEENYYFLTIEKDRTLDAGPKGNVARFMNHSCQPNCETQKWTVNGDTRVGLFAKCDIPADMELTFNYNLECIGKEKKICRCGAPNCTGFIGVKIKQDGPSKKSTKPKKKKAPPAEVVDNENPCFICGKVGDVVGCNNKICGKYYHLICVGLASWPEGGKWACQWHNCNLCSKRTIRCCVKCVNSYCPPHSEGNVRYDKLLGFVCFEHDPTKETAVIQAAPVPESIANESTEEGAITSTTPDVEKEVDELDSVSLSMRLNGCVTSTPLKKVREENSQDESMVSSASISEAKSKKRKKKKKVKRKSTTKIEVKTHVKNTANLFNSMQNEVKLSKFTPVRYLRTSRSTANSNRTDPDKDLPIRKRTRLRCGNTL